MSLTDNCDVFVSFRKEALNRIARCVQARRLAQGRALDAPLISWRRMESCDEGAGRD